MSDSTYIDKQGNKRYRCLRCHNEIMHVKPPTLLPEGVKSVGWEGWFHVDPTKEHFGPVGWRY